MHHAVMLIFRYLFIDLYLFEPLTRVGGERALAHPPADAGGSWKRFLWESWGVWGARLAFMSPQRELGGAQALANDRWRFTADLA